MMRSHRATHPYQVRSQLLSAPPRRGKAAGDKRWSATVLLMVMVASACAPATQTGAGPSADPLELRSLQGRAEEVCCWQRPSCDLPPHAFTTDGCTMWPDGDWGACCLQHDMAYWCGGSSDARQRADDDLRACVAARRGDGFATLTYLGVRAGGGGWIPAPWRWGYGWDWLEDPQSGK